MSAPSSGDSGAPASYPAASPNVLAVGGTTLKLDSAKNYLSESGWGGSGGGVSSYEAQPVYQKGVVTQNSTSRTNPDVAYDADPNTGYTVYYTSDRKGFSIENFIGGTSFVAPQLNGVAALLREAGAERS